MSKDVCHVGKYAEIVKEHIRQDVCQNLSAEYKIDDNDYCLLHAPTWDKDKAEFETLFSDKLKRNYTHFEAVVFPIELDFNHSNFNFPLNFKYASFLSNVGFYKSTLKYAYFDYATFYSLAQFHRSYFSELARFTGAVFRREAWFTGSHFKSSTFDSVTFSGHTQFNSGAKFIESADFHRARFLAHTEFDTASFECDVSFNEAEFGENSQVSFILSSFHKSASFEKAIFAGYLSFEGGKGPACVRLGLQTKLA